MAAGHLLLIKGEIVAGEDMTIAGRVEGRINAPGHAVILAAGSHIVGDIEAATIDVDGRVEGNLSASERLRVRESADIGGDLNTPRLAVADGAHVRGRVKMSRNGVNGKGPVV
jgi:cytoskeletal protein CcmA (bactofilin family)